MQFYTKTIAVLLLPIIIYSAAHAAFDVQNPFVELALVKNHQDLSALGQRLQRDQESPSFAAYESQDRAGRLSSEIKMNPVFIQASVPRFEPEMWIIKGAVAEVNEGLRRYGASIIQELGCSSSPLDEITKEYVVRIQAECIKRSRIDDILRDTGFSMDYSDFNYTDDISLHVKNPATGKYEDLSYFKYRSAAYAEDAYKDRDLIKFSLCQANEKIDWARIKAALENQDLLVSVGEDVIAQFTEEFSAKLKKRWESNN